MSTEIARGTKVRAVWTSTAEGIYRRSVSDGHEIYVRNEERHLYSVWLVPANGSITILPPDEPKAGSIVLDNEGDAWQRNASRGWVCVVRDDASDFTQHSWEDLIQEFGPITWLYSP